MPNGTPAFIEQRVVAFALGHPGFGPNRIAAELARPKWGGIRLSPNGVWRVLRRHGLNTRARRLGLIPGYAAPPEPARRPAPPPRHLEVSQPGELVQMDCFYVGRLQGTKGAVWQYTAIDVAARGWRLDAAMTDHGTELAGQFATTIEKLNAEHRRIVAGRPQTNGCVERVHETILEECWKPAFARHLLPNITGLREELRRYLRYYNTDRAHTGRWTR